MKKTISLVTSRLRVTKNKKILYRSAQQGHKKAKESGNVTRAKRRPKQSYAWLPKKVVRKYQGGTSQ